MTTGPSTDGRRHLRAAPNPPEAGSTSGPAEELDPRSPGGTDAGQVLPDRAGEDLELGRGDRLVGEEEERLLGERPPHWER